ncbi:MAG TPA: rhomboid family intramembrane serine protease [bacterium]
MLRKTVIRAPINRIWLAAREHTGHVGRPCPVCGRAMEEVPGSDGSPALDVCVSCYLVWFDGTEYELLPALPPPAPESEMPQQAREILALERVRELREDAEQQWGAAEPDEWWKFVPGVLGMPVEYGDQAVRITPWATWTIAALIAAISIWGLTNLERAIALLGLIPAEFMREGGATLLTAFFVHGGVLHLIGNVYFLLLFGDNVEEFLGNGRFLILLVAATLTGSLLHVALDPRSSIPVIGASGGISGLIAFYVLRFPRARLGVLVGPLFVFRWVRMPAYVLGLVWVLFQAIGAWQQIAGVGNVSALAHLGGAAAGVLFWFVWRSSG